MIVKGNQTATTTRGSILNRFHCGLKAWSVQGSNLRPPVYAGLGKPEPIEGSPSLIVAKARPFSRTTGESAASNGNRTAIPDPWSDRNAHLLLRWVS